MSSKIVTSDGHGEKSSYFDVWKAYENDLYHAKKNPHGVIQMGLAENQAVANLMGRMRGNRVTFDPDRTVMSGGATGAHETVAFCLADPGDAFLVPNPYYPGCAACIDRQTMAMRDFKISKTLKYSDLRSKIGLPNEIVEHMIPIMNGQHFMDLKVVDSRSQEWKLRYYTRPNGKRRGPVFTVGWPRFVRAKSLQAGDKLTFSGHQVRDDDGQLKMKFTIEVTFKGAEPVTVDVQRFEFEPVNATAIMTFQGQPIIDHN